MDQNQSDPLQTIFDSPSAGDSLRSGEARGWRDRHFPSPRLDLLQLRVGDPVSSAPAELVSPRGRPPSFSRSSPPKCKLLWNENIVTLPTSPTSSQAIPEETTSCMFLTHPLHPTHSPRRQEATSCRRARAQSRRGWISSRGSANRNKSMGSRNPKPHTPTPYRGTSLIRNTHPPRITIGP